MAAIDDIEIPSLLFTEGSAPATPASGFGRLYVKTTGLYFRGDNGTEVGPMAPAAGTFVGCSATRTTDQTAIVNDTDTTILFNGTDDFDTNTLHDPAGANPERITVASGLDGKWQLGTYIIWDTNATGYRSVALAKNGTAIFAERMPAVAGTQYTQHSVTFPVVAAVATDYFTIIVRQLSTANRIASGSVATLRFTAHYLGA